MNRPAGIANSLKSFAASLALALTMCMGAFGQSATDGATPPSIAPGSPAGSYALSGIDTVDLYSGKPIPLVSTTTAGLTHKTVIPMGTALQVIVYSKEAALSDPTQKAVTAAGGTISVSIPSSASGGLPSDGSPLIFAGCRLIERRKKLYVEIA